MNTAVSQEGGGAQLMATVSIMLATVMQVLDMTIANVALPHMQGSMSATLDQIDWVLTSYIVASAIMTPPTGYLTDRFGRKRLFMTAVGGFTIASMLCGTATSLVELVFFRIVQGAFGASLVPLSQSLLLDTYPREKHGSAMALWGVGVMVGPILGPTLGGYLTEVYNWRWVFYINLPVGILALLGIAAFTHETERNRHRPFDLFGFALLSLAIGAMQLMFDRGTSQNWFDSAEVTLEAVSGVLFLYLFLVHMFTARHPFIEPALFKDRNLVVGLMLIFFMGIILLATLALLPPFLQNLAGYPVITTGFVLAPRGVGTMGAMIVVGRLINKVDVRYLIVFGMLMMGISLWEMAGFTADVDIFTLVHTGIVQGIGFGFIFVPLSTVTFSTLAPHLRTEGTSMFSLMRNLGSSLGISIMVTLLGYNVQTNHAVISEVLTPFSAALKGASAVWDITTTQGLAALNAEVTRQAASISYMNDFRLMLWMTLCAVPLLLLLRPARQAPGPAAA
ncbi:MAG: DHA2 family efflux MFS transporter permease subunit [Arenicellales bacterium]